MTAVLAIGSNLGDRLAALQAGVRVLRPVAASPVYETDPWGPVEQGDFLNAVVLVDCGAAEAWERALAAEAAAGRTRVQRCGPRTLDVDVIVADCSAPGLTLPHPRAHERAFVLVPWLALDADAVLPGHGRIDLLLGALDVAGVHARPDLELVL